MAKVKARSLISVFIFCFIIIAPMFAWLIIGAVSIENPSIMESIDFDLGEKRQKATLSEIIDPKTITSELENYYNDRIPFRSILITKKNDVDTFIEAPYKDIEKDLLLWLIGGRYNNVKVQAEEVDGEVKLYMDDAVDMFNGHALRKEEIDPYIDDANYPIKYLSKDVIIGQNDWLYLYASNMGYYIGREQVKNNKYADYIKPYETIANLCKSKNKEFVILICPEKEEIYDEYMPAMEIKDYIEKPQKIKEYVATSSTLHYLYPKEELVKSKAKYRTYMKYDSHWSQVGGYIAANKIKEALGIKTVPLREWKIEKIPEINKDLIAYGHGDRKAYPDGFEYVIEYKPEITNREVFVEKNGPILTAVQYSSNAPDKRKVVILGDSFRSALFSILCKDFAVVTSTSFEYIWNASIDKALKEADIIIFQAVTRNENATIPLMCQKVYNVLNNK